jgi:hypothetical protein
VHKDVIILDPATVAALRQRGDSGVICPQPWVTSVRTEGADLVIGVRRLDDAESRLAALLAVYAFFGLTGPPAARCRLSRVRSRKPVTSGAIPPVVTHCPAPTGGPAW